MGFSSVSPSSVRDDNASVFSTSFSQPHSASPSDAQSASSHAHSIGTVGRRRVEREQFSLALDPSPSTPTSVASSTSAGAFQSSSSSSTKSRRPSSVFEHVGGMLDRFGRRLHSRSEARDSTSSSKRPSSSVLFLAGIGAGASDSSEAVSLEGELSPSASNSVHQTPFGERYKRSGSTSSTSIEASTPASPALTRKDTDQSTTASRLSAVGSPPVMHRNHSAGSSSFSHHDANLANRSSPSGSQFGAAIPANSSSTQSRRLSVIDRVLIQVTEDNERFSVVDISGLNSADAVKERMLSKLHLFDEDPSSFALSRTEIGAVGSTGPRLDDDELLAMCWQMGDDKGSLKFLLHQIAPPSTAGRPMMPPPQQQHFSPRIVTNDLAEGSSTTNTATTPTSNSRQEYSKSASLSSRSSIGEQSHQGDSAAAATAAANDQSSDSALAASVRPQSGLIRSRANNQRRSLAGSTSTTEDVQSLKMSENDTVGRGGRLANSSLQDDGSSPIEEISDALDVEVGRLDASRRQQLRSSAMQMRHSIHGQWDSEAGTSSSSSSSRTLMGPVEPSSPKLASSTTSASSTQSRPSALRTASHPAPTANDLPSSQQSASHAYSEVLSPSSTQSNVPRSLLAGGGREQRPLTHPHDCASRMYTGVSSSSEYTGVSSSSDFDYDYGEDARMRPSRPSASSSTVSDNFRSFPEPTHRSQSANPFGPRPSTSDARSDFRAPFGGGMNAGQHQQQAHMSQPPSSSAMTSPISPLARPFDRERSSSFGAGPPFHGYNPSLMHQVSMQELRGHAHPTSKLSDPPLRPIVTSQQHIPHMQSSHHAGYGNGPPPRPMPNSNMFADRRYMSGPAPLPNVGRPPMYEFGARSSVYDSRTAYSAPRPSPMMSDRTRFNTSGPGGMPHPGHPNHQAHHQGHPHALREDPAFMTMHFPASNSRMVSEFQRTATSSQNSLQPGMTVQESMQQNVWSPVHQQSPRPGAPSPMQFRPNTQPQPVPHRVMRTESFTGSSPMMHTASMSSSYGRDSRPQQKSSIGPPRAHDLRSETPSANSQLPASMRYYYNPATPHTASRAAVPAALTPSSPRASNGQASSSSSAAASPAQTPFAQLNNKATERYSGSSFNTTESSMHTRVPSSNDGRRLDGEHSAPSSARSSRTSRSMSPSKDNEKAATELPYANNAHGLIEGDTEELMSEEDLLNIRPLPRLPAVENISLDGRPGSAKGESKDEDTFRAGQWNHVIAKIGAEREGGTITAVRTSSGSPLQTTSAGANASPTKFASSHAILGTDVIGQGPASAEDAAEEGEGAFATFDDDDDDEDDQGGTWAQPLDTAVKTTPTPSVRPAESLKRVQSPDHDEGTLKPDSIQSPVSQRGHSPRRPVLTLNIETPKTASPQRIDDAELPETSLSALSNARPTPSPASSNLIGRRSSFAGRERGEWAFRPPPEQLYENLDDFFSKHDLDKPVIDPATGLAPMSPQSGSPRAADVPKMTSLIAPSATPSVAAPAPAPAAATSTSPVTMTGLAGLGKSRMQHQKSIRIVAQDRKRLLEKTEAADRRKPASLALATNDLSRRRSTKLWGGRVIEVTPADTSGAVTHGDSPTSTTSSTEGKPVFKWVKGDLIGKGTYGRVYLALNATTGEMIAVKQVELPTTDSDREDARQKSVVTALKSEIETLKDLDHPNIVSYLGFEETRANLSIFLEYVPGGSVGSCLRKHGKLDEATIKSFLQQILNGLNYLHGRGILHRDLKADNLLVDYDGIVKISDFGTVRKSEDIYGNVASMSMQGSIFWMAPEVVSLSRAGYSAKVDIWSLGCVVLEMFAGRRPWSDEEAVQAMFKIGAERRAPPIPPDVRLSKAAAHFLKTCFAVDPNQRPTASRLLEHVFPHAEVGWAFNMSSLYRQLHR